MLPSNIPETINIETLLDFFPESKCRVTFSGLHMRNTYNDLVDAVENTDGTLTFSIGRNSLYDILPEYLFHPIDRFERLSAPDEKEAFTKELEAQEQEITSARSFFAPFDLLLLRLRMDVHKKLMSYAEYDTVLANIIGDRMTEQQKNNRFIKHILPLLPSYRLIRGNKTLLTFLLRKVFIEENLFMEVSEKTQEVIDSAPRYNERLSSSLDSLYVGNVFYERVPTYSIHYWSDNECNDMFMQFVDEIEVLRCFIQEYFMALDEVLFFDIIRDSKPIQLSNEIYHYLNFNTNL